MILRKPHQSLVNIRALGTLLLIAVYFCGIVRDGHWHFHHHTVENETLHHDGCINDKCHASIYHPSLGLQCGHKHHFLPEKEKCTDCQQFHQSPNILPSESKQVRELPDFLPISLNEGILNRNYQPYLYGRAPPVMV